MEARGSINNVRAECNAVRWEAGRWCHWCNGDRTGRYWAGSAIATATATAMAMAIAMTMTIAVAVAVAVAANVVRYLPTYSSQGGQIAPAAEVQDEEEEQ